MKLSCCTKKKMQIFLPNELIKIFLLYFLTGLRFISMCQF